MSPETFVEDPDWTTLEEAEEYVIKLKKQIADLTRRLEEANDLIWDLMERGVGIYDSSAREGTRKRANVYLDRILAEKPTGRKPSVENSLRQRPGGAEGGG